MNNLYKLPAEANPDKVFIVNRSELEGRMDPSIYKNRFQYISNKYANKYLFELAYINPTTSFSAFKSDSEISFIPMEIIDEKNGVANNLLSKKIQDSKGFTRFKENDLIWAKITPCMQNGKSCVVRGTLNGFACGSTEFFVIRPKSDNILIDYIHFILRDKRILQGAENYFGGSAGQQRVSKDFLLGLNIPLPPLEIQQQIVDFYQEAYNQKQQKEAEANALLDGIDNYLLGELGITLPEKDNSLEKRVFITQFSEVAGGRLDPDYNNPYYDNLIDTLDKIYTKVKLKDISKSIFQGVGRCLSTSSQYTLLKVKNIKQGNILDFEDVEFIESVPKEKILQNNDILSPFIGEAIRQYKFSIFKEQFKLYTIDNNTGVIRVDSQICHADYICEILNSVIVKIQIQKLIGGGGVPFLGSTSIKQIQIPLPPLDKQNEIAEHIQDIRERAKQLQEEAKNLLDKAKQQVEQIILG